MISTGVYHYPHEAAAIAAIEAIINWMVKNSGKNMAVKIVTYDKIRQQLYLDHIQAVILYIITPNSMILGYLTITIFAGNISIQA